MDFTKSTDTVLIDYIEICTHTKLDKFGKDCGLSGISTHVLPPTYTSALPTELGFDYKPQRINYEFSSMFALSSYMLFTYFSFS